VANEKPSGKVQEDYAKKRGDDAKSASTGVDVRKAVGEQEQNKDAGSDEAKEQS